MQAPAYTLVANASALCQGQRKKKGRKNVNHSLHIVWVYRALTELSGLVVSRLHSSMNVLCPPQQTSVKVLANDEIESILTSFM